MKAYSDLWQRSFDIASGAGHVIPHRLKMLQHSPWAIGTWIESYQMVFEKVVATQEAWWSLWRDALASSSRVRWTPQGLAWKPQSAHAAARSAHRALAPMARRVKSNKARLARIAARR